LSRGGAIFGGVVEGAGFVDEERGAFVVVNWAVVVYLGYSAVVYRGLQSRRIEKACWSSISLQQALVSIPNYQVMVSDQICMLAPSRVSDQAAWTMPLGPETNCT
jgi:hypothetical protein